MHSDLPLDELIDYRPDVAEPSDFDAYWAQTLDASAGPTNPTLTSHDSVITSAEVFDVRFAGHGNTPIAAWLFVPMHIADDAPVIIEFIGYNGGRGRPIDSVNWSACGFAHLVVDSRGQGAGWRSSDTVDEGSTGQPGGRGFLTSGLTDPTLHYYSRLYTDAVRALQVPGEIPALAGRKVITTGGSQGGALALVAAALGNADAAVPDVPFLSHFRRAASITDSSPYSEIAQYCRIHPERIEEAFHTLSYFDVVNHAKRVTCPSLVSVGLTDDIAPPSTVFAAYNQLAGDKTIEVYEFNGHEGGGSLHFEKKVRFVQGLLSASSN